MHASLRRGLQIALVVGGGLVFSAQAHADDTTGVDSILGGNQSVVSVEIPVTVGGNAISVIGDSKSESASTTSGSTSGSTAGGNATSGEDSAAGGNQVVVPVKVPVTVGGNAISVIGHSTSESASTTSGSTSGSTAGGNATSGEDSAAGGNQVVAPVKVPVAVGGNAISVIGDSTSESASTTSGSSSGSTAGGNTTSGEDSLLGGNQVLVPIVAPVTAGGNAISGIGDSVSTGANTTSSTGGSSSPGENTTSGEDSLGGGNQILAPIVAPVTIGGNAISVIGDSKSESASTTSGSTSGSTAGENITSGEDSLLGGNQILVPIVAPVTAGGNAISGIGDSVSTGANTTSNTGGGNTTGGNTTSGEDSLGGGNQILLPIVAPVTIGGNAVSLVGDSTTEGSTTTGGSTPPVDEPTDPTDPTDPTVPVDPTDPGTPTHPGDVRDDHTATSRGGNVRTATSELAVMKPATAGLAYTGANSGALLGSAFLLLALGELLMLGTRRRTMTS